MYLKIDTLILADVFENFRKTCLKIYQLDPAKFLSAPGLAWQAALKNTEVKLELLTDIDMLLMAEKGISGGICNAIHRYVKANNNYIKIKIKIKNCHILNIGIYIIYMVDQCRKSFITLNKFAWIEDTSPFN